MTDFPEVRDGDLAQAWNVQNIADLLQGLYGINVRLTKWSHPTLATLRLANRTEGGPVLEILNSDLDEENPVIVITNEGLSQATIPDYLDLLYQAPAPGPPGAGSQTLRMYARLGHLYFKTEAGGEQEIPIGAPPGPTMRYSLFTGG